MPPTILIIEDEPSITANLRYALETEGFTTLAAATAREGKKLFHEAACDCVVLDVGLPDGSGFEVCKEIRKTSQVPILFLTARSDEIDKVVGLEIGADDYIVKPFSPRELTARIRAILRRIPKGDAGDVSPKSGADSSFRIDEARCKVFYRGKPLNLTRYEYKLLCLLARRPGHVFSRDQLMELVWDDPAASFDRTVDAHVKSLRAKLKAVDPSHDPIETHRGMGYSLKENP
jgi:two-component system catabolic regulation response regulator CreB